MYTSLKQNIVLTRKSHRCLGCSTISPRGTLMEKSDGVYEGSIQTTYFCPPCVAFKEKVDIWGDDGEMSEGDIWEFENYKQFRENFLNQIYV